MRVNAAGLCISKPLTHRRNEAGLLGEIVECLGRK
jgi:hypothetical protein